MKTLLTMLVVSTSPPAGADTAAAMDRCGTRKRRATSLQQTLGEGDREISDLVNAGSNAESTESDIAAAAQRLAMVRTRREILVNAIAWAESAAIMDYGTFLRARLRELTLVVDYGESDGEVRRARDELAAHEGHLHALQRYAGLQMGGRISDSEISQAIATAARRATDETVELWRR